MAKEEFDFEMTDDSGFLAIVDPQAYSGFIGEPFDFKRFSKHAIKQMKENHLLLWGTGMENIWRVRVVLIATKIKGFRETSGTITCTSGKIALSNYENLSMVAMYSDDKLPQTGDEIISLSNGAYQARIVQMLDPEGEDADESEADESEFDFIIELTPSKATGQGWSKIPWFVDG